MKWVGESSPLVVDTRPATHRSCSTAAELPQVTRSGEQGETRRGHTGAPFLFSPHGQPKHTPPHKVSQMFLQLDFSTVVLSKEVPDVVLVTEAEEHKTCFHLPQSEGCICCKGGFNFCPDAVGRQRKGPSVVYPMRSG